MPIGSSTQDLLNQAWASAQAEHATVAEFVAAAAGSTAVVSTGLYDANGVSAPNELGLVKLRAVDEYRSTHPDKGVPEWICCTPGLLKLDPHNPDQLCAYKAVQTAIGDAQFRYHLTGVVSTRYHRLGLNPDPTSSARFVDLGAVPDAKVVPADFDTAQECADYVLTPYGFVPHSDGGGFSPGKPSGSPAGNP